MSAAPRRTCRRLTLFGDGPADHVLPHVVLLGQVEQLADLAGSLGAQAAGDGAVGEARDVLLACGGPADVLDGTSRGS